MSGVFMSPIACHWITTCVFRFLYFSFVCVCVCVCVCVSVNLKANSTIKQGIQIS